MRVNGKILLISFPMLFLVGCMPPSTKKRIVEQTNPMSLESSYDKLMETPCKFWTIRDLIAYAYNIAPYGEKEKFLQLYRTLPRSCLNSPVSNVDWGVIKGTIREKERSCLGNINFKGGKVYENIYNFVVKKCSNFN